MADGDHDGFFKDVFRRPAEAAGLLRATLPEGLVAALDWGRLEPLTGETEESSGGGHRRDLVFRVPFLEGALGEGTPSALEVLMLLEHKSRPAPDLPLTLLGYMVRTWEDQLKRKAALAPIVPVVVYHGERPWRVPMDFGTWLVPSAGPRELLSAVIPDFVYLLDGWRPPDPSLYKGTPTVRLARFMLDHGRAPDLRRLLLSWRPEVRAVLEEGDGTESWHPVVGFFYYLGKVACGGDVEEAHRWLLEAAGEEEDDMGSWGFEGVKAFYREQGLKEGRQEGRQEGLQEGHRKGQADGVRVLFVELLVERFGPIGEDTSARVASADLDTLKQWSRRLVHVDTLADVFID